ncbi:MULTISPECIES: ornithine carbamoyltransferase [Psychrilyobacter]|uniref:Ornithine carbamoyltransferase n=1 Tax=Psychrilyobacter piezotolerans TaxID=2293438 RepID=A0ABX9KEC2_9FUSO|nr:MULTISPECIES: ornithine carbamoyltransferase [Psychrilyobacter]MCS5422013.1 ornithine carbamoyltransferase [Psychrilyobacter sp. S5]NDI78927.1 ornithine carbamoyltransferase [Psychrilyobacter piezotolerans]RDE59319.1 ornithine carbamoyltransferase [Psychrilyobacter sp. S5]REI39849.1 ornithine carbamoyltransferase [Psychrilyobacter piezotolerans]
MIKNKNFLKLLDYTPEEFNYLLDLSAKLKKDKKEGTEKKYLSGKNIVLIFEKDSTRTRCAFEVGAMDQGANITYLGPSGSQIGKKESIKDTARVLGGFYDGIQYRGYAQETVEILGEFAGVPVWNGLTDEFHPTQILADFLTIKEKFGKLEGIKMAYLGDGRNNMGNSLMIGAALVGMDFKIVAPKDLFPEEELIKKAQEIAETTGAQLTFTDSLEEGVSDTDVVYTDVWVSMGEEEGIWKERIEKLLPYQVNSNVMDMTAKNSIFLHCLPAFHDQKTVVGKDIWEKFGIQEMEVTDEVFEGSKSIVFKQAENRLHTIKAIMVATLAGEI